MPVDPAPKGWPIARPGLLMIYVGSVCFIRIGAELDEAGEAVHRTELARAIDARPNTVRVGVVYDVPLALGITALGRSDIAAMLNQRRDKLRQTTAAFALATPSAFVRGMLQAVFWIAPPPYPSTMVESVEDALHFVARHLSGIDVPAMLAAYRSEVLLRTVAGKR